jgi:hypothetical protein
MHFINSLIYFLAGMASNDLNQEYIDVLKNQLMTTKQKLEEKFLFQFMCDLENDPTFEKKSSADLTNQERLLHATKKLNECSVVLAHKYKPILKDFIALKEQEELVLQYSVIKARERDNADLAKKYSQCFNAFINASDDVSIRAIDNDLIKNIDIKDAFTLTYFSFATAQRQESDNLAQLAICGLT